MVQSPKSGETLRAERGPDAEPIKGSVERELGDIVECNGVCGDEYHRVRTVDVVAGEVIGDWSDPEPHLGVTGVESSKPEHQHYCIDCADHEFGIAKEAGERSIEESNRYLTPSNAVSFLLGFTIMLVVASVLVV